MTQPEAPTTSRDYISDNALLPTTSPGKKQSELIKDIVEMSRQFAVRELWNTKKMKDVLLERNTAELELNRERTKHESEIRELEGINNKLHQRHDKLMRKNSELKEIQHNMMKGREQLKKEISGKEHQVMETQKQVDKMKQRAAMNACRKKEQERNQAENKGGSKTMTKIREIKVDPEMVELEGKVDALKKDVVILDKKLERARNEVNKLHKNSKKIK